MSPGYGNSSRKGRRAARDRNGEPPNLREIPLFALLEDETLSRLSQDSLVETYDDGEVIFRQGDPVAAIVVILRGYVKLIRIAPSGDETMIAIHADGESVNEPPSVPNETYRVSAESVGPTAILRVPTSRFARLLKESTPLCAAVRQDAKDKLESLVAEIESLKSQNADQRLARFLLSLCPPNAEQCRLRLPYDKRLIAAQLGIKQETLSRAFAKLRECGVRTETRDVLVESVSRLMQQCDNLAK